MHPPVGCEGRPAMAVLLGSTPELQGMEPLARAVPWGSLAHAVHGRHPEGLQPSRPWAILFQHAFLPTPDQTGAR